MARAPTCRRTHRIADPLARLFRAAVGARRPARRPDAPRIAVPPGRAARSRECAAPRSSGPRSAARRAVGARGAARDAQDDGLRALSARRGGRGDARRRERRWRWRHAHRLVRAGASDRARNRALFRAPLCAAALGHPDARPLRAMGWPATRVQCRRASGGCASRRRSRAALAHVLRKHLQPGAPEDRDDEEGDAAALLEEPARGGTDRPAGGLCAPAQPAHGGAGRHRAGPPPPGGIDGTARRPACPSACACPGGLAGRATRCT